MQGSFTTLDILAASGSALILLLTLASGAIRNRFWVSDALLCFFLGLSLGFGGLNIASIDPLSSTQDGFLLKELARATIAVSVMSAALRIPDTFIATHGRGLAVVLSVGMLGMWGVSTLCISASLSLGVATAAICGAVVTPTDPVLASSVLEGKKARAVLPRRLRAMIIAESGSNDGLALPLILLPILLMKHDSGSAWSEWFLRVILWEVLAAALIGVIIGIIAGKLFSRARESGVAESDSTTAVILGLTFCSLSTGHLMGGDGILAVFVSGNVFNYIIRESHQDQHEHFHEAVERFFVLPIFIIFGMSVPTEEWLELGWSLLVTALAVLILRRLPIWWLVIRRTTSEYARPKDNVFSGWFGPVGVAAIYYSTLALEKSGAEEVWTISSFIIAVSIVVHGISATPFTRLYGASTKSV